MRAFTYKLLCAVFACMIASGAMAQRITTDGEFKCPEIGVRVILGAGIEVCVPEDVASCWIARHPQVWARGSGPGGCTWCVEICATIDLLVWDGEACWRPFECDDHYSNIIRID